MGAGAEGLQLLRQPDTLPKSPEGAESACALLPIPHTLVLKSASSPQRNELHSPKGHSWSLNNKIRRVWVTLTPYLGYHQAWSTSFAGRRGPQNLSPSDLRRNLPFITAKPVGRRTCYLIQSSMVSRGLSALISILCVLLPFTLH